MDAFAVPIQQGKADEWRAWAGELTGARKEDFEALNERHGLTKHSAWLQENLDGSKLVIVVIDGPGAPTFLQSLADSDHEVDAWFKSKVEEIHPMDFSGPIPPPNPQYL